MLFSDKEFNHMYTILDKSVSLEDLRPIHESVLADSKKNASRHSHLLFSIENLIDIRHKIICRGIVFCQPDGKVLSILSGQLHCPTVLVTRDQDIIRYAGQTDGAVLFQEDTLSRQYSA